MEIAEVVVVAHLSLETFGNSAGAASLAGEAA
jgi:hypothetical protein